MINYKNELLVTKEIVSIIEKFTRITIIKKMLNNFSFDGDNVSELLKNSNEKYADMTNPSQSIDDDIWDFVYQFLTELDTDSKTALYICVLNKHYDHIEDDFLGTDASLELDENNLDKKFGRYLAGKIYEPKNTELETMVVEHLKSLLINFSTEHDFSLIDENTKDNVNYVIDNYTFI